MAYNLRQIFADIDTRLSLRPRSSLCELSRASGFERHLIERAVRIAKGVSFREYQKRAILTSAVTMLTNGRKYSIKRIALELGYWSPESFSRFIKKTTGRSASEIRQDAASVRSN